MTLTDLICKSKKDEKKIRQEFEVMVEYQKAHPWILQEIIDEMKQDEPTNDVPSIDDLLTFKEHMLLDVPAKVFHQIHKENPLLIDSGSFEVYYYIVKPNFFKNQLKKGLKLGEQDENGNVVTGSNLVIEAATIDFNDFISGYYSFHN